VLPESAARIEAELAEDAVVLDVGGWANAFPRADWIIDLLPYETRGLYGGLSRADERFTADTWVTRDICDRAPWPFADNQFDFAICSHTLEDIRDPVWVCSELSRVAKAGYVEVPSRLEEQSHGFEGPWTGWSHHRWISEQAGDGTLEFSFKAHLVHGGAHVSLPKEVQQALTPQQRVLSIWWQDVLPARERIFTDPDELADWLTSFASEHRIEVPRAGLTRRARRWLAWKLDPSGERF
jgi:hypothetical protein